MPGTGSIPISVLIAAYNQAQYVGEALESVLAQDIDQGFVEVIVINDGSTDGTRSVLDRYSDRVSIVDQENQGLVATCNRGLSLATGHYIARLDADDYAAPTWLRRTLETLDACPGGVCVYPDYVEVIDRQERRISLAAGNLYDLIACGTLLSADAIRRAGGFRPMYWEEYDLYLRLRQIGTFVHLPEPLYYYRKHSASMTADPERRRAGWRELVDAWGERDLLEAGTSLELSAVIEAQ